MEHRGRRILLAVEPGMLEGALACVLAAGTDDEIVPVQRLGRDVRGGAYDAAVVSGELPADVRVGVVITLPDRRGSGGKGTVRRGAGEVRLVDIGSAQGVIELLERYVPRL